MAYKQLKLWFDKDLATLLAQKILTVTDKFDRKTFVKSINKGVGDLELKDRVELIADQLYIELGKDFTIGVKVLLDILGPENEEETGMFTNFYWVMPIAKYVEKYGLGDFKLSMKALEEITKRNTSEYAIRPFLEKYPKQTLKKMTQWSKDKNRHVRRLASEGGRPRLPWSSKLQIFINDPKPLFPILDRLKDDPSKYVQKSVANCMNDILKDNPDIGKELIDMWLPESTKERRWIIKHACRNLIKQSDPWCNKVINSL